MKEGVIDVLMYIFSSYADHEENLPEDRDGIDADLRAAGFDPLEIDKAFEWLDGLAEAEDETGSEQSDIATRVLAPEESARLAYNAQGFLLFLEQSGVLPLPTEDQLLWEGAHRDEAVALRDPRRVRVRHADLRERHVQPPPTRASRSRMSPCPMPWPRQSGCTTSRPNSPTRSVYAPISKRTPAVPTSCLEPTCSATTTSESSSKITRMISRGS